MAENSVVVKVSVLCIGSFKRKLNMQACFSTFIMFYEILFESRNYRNKLKLFETLKLLDPG